MGWYLLWWLVICNGNTALAVTIVNRLHGCRLPLWVIYLSHKLHYLVMAAVPAVTLLATGWHGPRLLQGGSWSALPAAWWLVFGLLATATAVFWGSVIRRHLKRVPIQQTRLESQDFDLARELGGPPVGTGPFLWMTRLPGNEIFRLQVTQRELHLPRLPPAFDGVSILHLGDLHFIGTVGRPYFERVMEHAQKLQPDLICFTGDLLDDPNLMSWLPATLGKLRAPLGCFFILGNHDWHLDMAAIRRELCGLGWQDVSVAPQQIERNGDLLHLAGSEYPWMDRQPTFAGVPEAALRILLSHTPDNIAQARRQQVDLMLSGHNHGGQIRLPVIGPVYCPSRFGCYYAEGLFHESPTLLHVSRGLSGRHPLRYGCLPEITKLLLRNGPPANTPQEDQPGAGAA